MKKTLPINFFFSMLVLFSFTLLSCQDTDRNPPAGEANEANKSEKSPGQESAQEFAVDENGLSKDKVVIKTVHGDIIFHFYPKVAPQTVAHIAGLIRKGFYNGLTFHRVEPGFVIQGGDPSGNGTGGSGKNVKAEFTDQLKHVRGTVAMARAQDPDSGDSQFYIALDNLPSLDGQYTIFGLVTEGMEVVEKVVPGDKMNSVEIVK